MTFEVNQTVVLTAAVRSDEGDELQAGDVGTIIHLHSDGAAFVVEFMALGGETVAIATVLPAQARPITGADLTHARIVRTAV